MKLEQSVTTHLRYKILVLLLLKFLHCILWKESKRNSCQRPISGLRINIVLAEPADVPIRYIVDGIAFEGPEIKYVGTFFYFHVCS